VRLILPFPLVDGFRIFVDSWPPGALPKWILKTDSDDLPVLIRCRFLLAGGGSFPRNSSLPAAEIGVLGDDRGRFCSWREIGIAFWGDREDGHFTLFSDGCWKICPFFPNSR